MGLAIAVGGKALSSRPVAPPQPIPDDANDGSGAVLEPVVLESPPRLVTATSHDHKLSATCSISYYDMVRPSSASAVVMDQVDDNDAATAGALPETETTSQSRPSERIMAEIRIQISPLCQAFSSKYRDVLHRIPFPLSQQQQDKEGDTADRAEKDFVPLSPQVEFASDGRNLACLVPHPRLQQSILVMFQLRKPRTQHRRPVTLPRPSYLGPPPSLSMSPSSPVSPASSSQTYASSSAPTSITKPPLVRVPTNPQVTTVAVTNNNNDKNSSSSSSSTPLLNASAICNTNAQSGSLLLAGCVDGSIVVISYRPAQVAGILHHPGQQASSNRRLKDHGSSMEQSSSSMALSSTPSHAIKFLAHRTNQYSESDNDSGDEEKAEDGSSLSPSSRGMLVAIEQNGAATLFSSHLKVSSASNMLLMQLQMLRTLGRRGPNHTRCNATNEDSFVRAVWMGPSFLALLQQPMVHSSNAAQVWAVRSQDTRDDVTTAAAVAAIVEQPVATLIMSVERLDESSQGSFALESTGVIERASNADAAAAGQECFQVESFNTATSLHYDEDSGCLAVSSFVLASHGLAIPFACLWHWRTNVVGLTLSNTRSQHNLIERDNGEQRHDAVWQVPIYSKVCFGVDFSSDGGKHLVHLLSDSAKEWKSQHQNRLRKEVYSLALLSPSESRNGADFGIEQPSSLMVSSKCVTFPFVSSPFTADDCEFVWKDARIPAAYTSTFGSPKLASIGRKRCRSIAVASSKGLCVLDCVRMASTTTPRFTRSSKADDDRSTATQTRSIEGASKLSRIDPPKWRLFGNEADERVFHVEAMTWWEGQRNSGRRGSFDNSLSDDLLVAVISVRDESKEKKPHQLYLACWSPRRLDQTNQMMRRWKSSSKSRSSQTWGVRLPEDFNPSGISLLSDPSSSLAIETNSNDAASLQRRAVLLLCSNGGALAGTGSVNYHLYHLKVDRDGVHPDTEETRFVVKAKLRSDGMLNAPETSSRSQSVSGVFLASASFDFDSSFGSSTAAGNLFDNSNGTLSTANANASTDDATSTFLATVGIIRSPCEGLEAVLVTANGVTCRKEIIAGTENTFTSLPSSEVSTYWHSHTIPFDPSYMSNQKRPESFFVWSIELCDGSLLCWSVPYACRSPSEHVVRSVDTTEHASNVAVNEEGIPPSSVDHESENALHQSLFGSVTPIGDSSSWMQETSIANRTGFTLGCIPSTRFGCMLRCSQSGKDLHRFAPVENEDNGSARDLDHEIFCLGSTELAPPSLVPSLFASLGGRVEKVGSDPFDSHVTYTMDFSSTSVNAYRMLNSVDNEDTVLVALRTLIVRTIELIAKESDKMGNDISAQHSVFLLTTTFADVVDAAKKRLSPMQFASLFLGIGRQIEPSSLSHLFPLPLATSQNELQKYRSVEDLFQESIRHGSISVAAAALPLFSSKRLSLKMCGCLLRHCLETFEENADSAISVAFDLSSEERRMMRGIFHFGVRIEDSGTMPPMEALDDTDPLRVYRETDESTENGSQSFDSSMDGSPDRRNQLVSSQMNSSRICQLFSPSGILGSFNKRPKEEDAIFDAASSFILSGFDEVNIGFESVNGRDKSSTSRHGDVSVSSSSESGEITMAGIVASFLLPLAFPTESSKQTFRWKRTTALAQVLVGDHDNGSRHDESTPRKIREVTRLAESWSLDEIIFSLQISNSSLHHDYSAADKEKWIVRLLKRHLTECGMMMSASQASTVLRLSLALLERYSFGRDVKARAPGLLLLGIIVAHCAGYSRDLVDARPRNKFTTSYVAALHEMRSRR